MPPYLVTSDIHGCFPEFVALLEAVGFTIADGAIQPPADRRRLLFAGDLTDRGDEEALTILLFERLVKDGWAEVAAIGNHDRRLKGALSGKPLPERLGGLPQTLQRLLCFSDPQLPCSAVQWLFASQPLFSSYGPLLIAHAALTRADLNGQRENNHIVEGMAEGEDEHGRPIRVFGWAKEWAGGEYQVVFGHNTTPQRLPCFLESDQVIALDSGCVFGGALAGYLWPERKFVAVRSLRNRASDTPIEVTGDLQVASPLEMIDADEQRAER